MRAPAINVAQKCECNIFKGKKFTVLDGSYVLRGSTLDEQQAKSEGWFDDAKSVRCQQDVVNFVIKNGGTVQLTANEEIDIADSARSSLEMISSSMQLMHYWT